MVQGETYGRSPKTPSKRVLRTLTAIARTRNANSVSLWIQRINAAARSHGMTYSEFMGKVNAKGIQLNRKVLADLAMNNPAAFEKIVKTVQ